MISNELYSKIVNDANRESGVSTAVEDLPYDFQQEYEQLVREELGFFTEEPELFPAIDLHWDEPAKATNAIIDVDRNSNHDFGNIFAQLEEINCKDIQIRIFDMVPFVFIEDICHQLDDLMTKSVEFIFPYNQAIHYTQLLELVHKHERIKSITISSAPQSEIIRFRGYEPGHMGNVFYTSQVIDSNRVCGIINPLHFSVNISTFTEAQKHNSCLNRKVSVDVDGAIKNCPSMSKTYGNVTNDRLIDVIDDSGFTAMWNLDKSQVDVCKDCEFRYICTDCRAFLKQPGNDFSKPGKCNYDPYSATWRQ